MRLLLTSNGFIGSSIEKDFWELAGNNKKLKIGLIPTAGDPIEWVPEKEGDQPKDYVAKLIRPNDSEYGKGKNYQYFADKGHNVVVVDLKGDPEEIRNKLESADVIYVSGGDANWLLDWAKKARLGDYLKDLLKNGAVYVGVSAGNALLVPDIGLSWWEPDWKLDHVSFGIVDFLVSVHNKESELPDKIKKEKARREYMQTLMPYPWKIYFLLDGQAIKVDGDKVEHIGQGIKMYV